MFCLCRDKLYLHVYVLVDFLVWCFPLLLKVENSETGKTQEEKQTVTVVLRIWQDLRPVLSH